MLGVGNRKAEITLGVLVLLAIMLRLAVAYNAPIFFDGCGYIMHAWSLAEGRLTTAYWAKGIDHYYPPLYPLAIMISHLFIHDWVISAKAAAIFFSGLLLLPVFWLGKKMFGWEIALLACAALVAFPLLVEVGSNAYSEPLFLFLLALAMLWGWKMVAEQKGSAALLTGVWLGLAYLTRTQAIVGAVSAGLILTWFWLAVGRLSAARFAKLAALALLGFSLFAIPYEFYGHAKDGGWALRARQEFFKKGYRFNQDLQWEINEKTLAPKGDELINFKLARVQSPLAFIAANPEIYLNWIKLDFKDAFLRGFVQNRISPPLISISISILILSLILSKESRAELDKYAYCAGWFFPALILVPMTSSVLDRYFTPLILPLVFFAAAGAFSLTRAIARLLSGLFKVSLKPSTILPAILLIFILGLPHSHLKHLLLDKDKLKLQDQGHRELGRWVKDQTRANRKILMAPSPEAALFSGNYWYLLPVEGPERIINYAKSSQADYLLVESGFFGHHHLNMSSIKYFINRKGLESDDLIFLGRTMQKAKYEKPDPVALFQVRKPQ